MTAALTVYPVPLIFLFMKLWQRNVAVMSVHYVFSHHHWPCGPLSKTLLPLFETESVVFLIETKNRRTQFLFPVAESFCSSCNCSRIDLLASWQIWIDCLSLLSLFRDTSGQGRFCTIFRSYSRGAQVREWTGSNYTVVEVPSFVK